MFFGVLVGPISSIFSIHDSHYGSTFCALEFQNLNYRLVGCQETIEIDYQGHLDPLHGGRGTPPRAVKTYGQGQGDRNADPGTCPF